MKMSNLLPRPEYPRPDFHRENWLNLNGSWNFKFVDYDVGIKKHWYTGEKFFDREIIVPFPFQSKLSGIHDTSFHDIVWYQREFSIPKHWEGKRVLLHFGAVDYKSKVWLNGKFLGSNVGGYVPFLFDITDVLNKRNSLTLRVYDGHGEQPKGKQDSRLHPRGIMYTRVTGIWQTVWLESVGHAYISSIRTVPDIDRETIYVSLELRGETEGCNLLTVVMFAGSEEAKKEEKVRDGSVRLEISIPHIKLWSPETPNLYNVEFHVLKDEEILDKIQSYFGMRKVSIKNGKILLNNKPYYLKMALDQGYYPDGLYTAPSDEDLKRDVEAAKLLGLNGVRKHQLASEPRYLYWCDKIGLLVWGEMADWGMPLNKKNLFWEEWRRVIERDFNHPCIITWVPFNERHEAYENKENQKVLVEIYRRTKELDPTRLVIDTSGYAHTKTDILDIHDYELKSGDEFNEKWNKPPERYRRSLAKGFKYKGQPIILSEWGGWGIAKFKPIIDRPYTSYQRLPDEYTFISRYRDLLNAIMDEPSICGFCYTQLYDVEGEINGYLTYDRKWKVPPEKIAKIHGKIKT